jgi:hypothetical protein
VTNAAPDKVELAGLHSSPAGKYWLSSDILNLTGPDGFRYLGLRLAAESGPGVIATSADATINLALKEGYGIALFEGADTQQLDHVYSYGNVLCYRIFGSLRPKPHLDPDRYPETASLVTVPEGTHGLVGSPSIEILPQYARDVINRYAKAVAGEQCVVEFEVLTFPQIDHLMRIRLKVSGIEPTDEQLGQIGAAAAWCLPYAVIA